MILEQTVESFRKAGSLLNISFSEEGLEEFLRDTPQDVFLEYGGRRWYVGDEVHAIDRVNAVMWEM